MTTDERQRLLDRLEDAEGNLGRAIQALDIGKPWQANSLVYDAHAEVRAVRLALEEDGG